MLTWEILGELITAWLTFLSFNNKGALLVWT